MANVAINPVVAAEAGVDPSQSYTAAVAGNTYTVPNAEKPVLLQVHNAGGAAAHVTIQQPAEQSERAAGAGDVIAVAAGATVLIGPFDPNEYGEQLDVTVDAALSIAAVQLPLTQRKSYA